MSSLVDEYEQIKKFINYGYRQSLEFKVESLKMGRPKKVAIVRLTAMGDIVHSAVVLQFIKKNISDVEISWIVEEKFAEILNFNPDIDRVIPINLQSLKIDKSLSNIKNLYHQLKNSGEFDLIIDVQGLIKSAFVARIVGKNVVGLDLFSARERIASLLYKKRYRVDYGEIAPFRFASLVAKAMGFSLSKDDLGRKEPYLFWDNSLKYETLNRYLNKNRSEGRKSVLIVSGASKPSKIYPKERFVELISHLRMYNVLILADSEKEREDGKFIESNSIAKLLPRLNLNELKYIISEIDLLIGNDTGPSHIAWALNVKSVVLFGSTPPSMMMQGKKNVAISSKSEGEYQMSRDGSISEISPLKVAQVAKRLLSYE